MTTTVVNNLVFRAFFKKQRSTGPNFIDWYCNLRIVPSGKISLLLEQPIPSMPVPIAGQVLPLDVFNTYTAWVKALKEIEYDNFVQNYNMHGMGKIMTELHAMLKLHEKTLPMKEAAPALYPIRTGKVQKTYKNKKLQLAARGNNQEKGKSKLAYTPKPKIPPPPKKDNFAKDSICHQCGYGLRGSRKLKPGALSLYVGDGHHAAIEAIGTYHLCLLSGLILALHNYHYAPSITRGTILVSCLYDDGFINHFENDNTILVSRNNVVYFSVIPRNGIFEIDWSNSNTNDCSMYAGSNKRAKIKFDSTLLWHCRLGHISKKRIEKLQHDGLLNLTDNQSLRKSVSCMFGKMARKPYTHQVERAKDLLCLIHTDVYGPYRTVSKQKDSYFITFTNDFSQNKLGKTIKSLHSDRRGEYISQEFLDHLKEHGIIAHCTPPYPPQHNGVSERGNRTLLDIVRSMMSQTTLPMSFLDYALESAARILNMGCEALVKRDTLTKPNKLEPRSLKCIFIGYPKETMGYSFYYLHENKIFVARNAKFLENSLITQKESRSLEDLEIIQEEDMYPSVNTSIHPNKDDQEIDEPQSDIIPISRSTRTKHAPYRFVNPKYPNRVCKLKRSIYGLKKASRQWNKRFDDEIKKFRFTQNRDEPCVYKKASRSNVTFLILYIDDILIRGNHIPMLQDVKSYLGKCFAMKDLREAAYILEIKIYIDRSRVSCYTDAGYLTDVDDLKCETGYVFILNGGTVDWKSTKQSIFATSFAEAEYIATYDASNEVVWIRIFISRLGVVPINEEPITMYYDNTKTITIANESEITKGARHYRAKVHYLREIIELGDIKIEKVQTYENLVDPFTKALPLSKHSEHIQNIGMPPASSLM
nr:hypothetical protein [Tanacetum cinerariifolium]